MLASEGGGALYLDTLKNNRARTVPLVAELVPIIDRWSAGKEPEAWLFAAPGGGPLRESNWKRSVRWRAATVAAGVPDVRVHDLRHTAASLWPLARTRRWCSRVLGHATAAMTMDLYGHLVDASLWRAARLIRGTRGHLRPTMAYSNGNKPGQSTKKTITTWDFAAEPPIGIEPMTYALRGARAPAEHALAAPIARVNGTEGTDRTGGAGITRRPGPRTGPRPRPYVPGILLLYVSAADDVYRRPQADTAPGAGG